MAQRFSRIIVKDLGATKSFRVARWPTGIHRGRIPIPIARRADARLLWLSGRLPGGYGRSPRIASMMASMARTIPPSNPSDGDVDVPPGVTVPGELSGSPAVAFAVAVLAEVVVALAAGGVAEPSVVCVGVGVDGTVPVSAYTLLSWLPT